VVFFEDLRTLAHAGARNARLSAAPTSASTDAGDLFPSIDDLDERDRVNAILGRIGHKMTDEAYANYYEKRKPK
jgi:hypothetical protein